MIWELTWHAKEYGGSMYNNIRIHISYVFIGRDEAWEFFDTGIGGIDWTLVGFWLYYNTFSLFIFFFIFLLVFSFVVEKSRVFFSSSSYALGESMKNGGERWNRHMPLLIGSNREGIELLILLRYIDWYTNMYVLMYGWPSPDSCYLSLSLYWIWESRKRKWIIYVIIFSRINLISLLTSSINLNANFFYFSI